MTQTYQLRTDTEADRSRAGGAGGGDWFLRLWLPADTNMVASVHCQGDISHPPTPPNPPPDTLSPT